MNTTEHLLTCLAEEASEIVKDVTKSLRFGLDGVDVLNPTGPTNRERLVSELNDLMAVVEMLGDAGIIPHDWRSDRAILAKCQKVKTFMDYAEKKGALKS